MKKYSNNVSESEPTGRTPKLIGENWRDSSIYSATPPSQQPGDPNEHEVIYVDGSKIDRISQPSLPDVQKVDSDNISDQYHMQNERPNVDA